MKLGRALRIEESDFIVSSIKFKKKIYFSENLFSSGFILSFLLPVLLSTSFKISSLNIQTRISTGKYNQTLVPAFKNKHSSWIRV